MKQKCNHIALQISAFDYVLVVYVSAYSDSDKSDKIFKL